MRNIKDLSFDKLLSEGYETEDNSLKEVTYFNCLKQISEGVAKCPLQLKKEGDLGEKQLKEHYLYEKLRIRPNKYMSSVDCFKSFINIFKHKGIAGLYINRLGNGKIEGLYPVEITNVTIDDMGLINSDKNNKILYDFLLPGAEYGSCFDRDLILLKDFTLDGINTKATKNILSESIDTLRLSQAYLNNIFRNGLTNKMIVQYTSDIKEEKEIKKTQEKFNRLYSSNGRVFTVPAGYNVTSMDLKLSDAQFEQLRRLSKEEMAGVMGVPLTKLGFTKENAKSEEQDNLKFYQDTLLIIFQQIEQEMDYKLLTERERAQGLKIRFNVNVMLRTDALTQSQIISEYVKCGVYSLNDAKERLGIEKLEKDVTTLPSGQVTLQSLINADAAYQKGGE